MTGEIIQMITYGSIKDGDLDLVEVETQNVEIFAKTVQGYIVDFLPWCTFSLLIPRSLQSDPVSCPFVVKHIPDWVPGAQFKRDAQVFKQSIDWMRWRPYDMVKRKKVRPSSRSAVRRLCTNSPSAKRLQESHSLHLSC